MSQHTSLSDLRGHVRVALSDGSVMPAVRSVYHAGQIANIGEQLSTLFSAAMDKFVEAHDTDTADKQAFQSATRFARLGADVQGVSAAVCLHMVALDVDSLVSLETAHDGYDLETDGEQATNEMVDDLQKVQNTSVEMADTLLKLSACNSIGTVRPDTIHRFLRVPFYYLSHTTATMGETLTHPYDYLYDLDCNRMADYMYGNRTVVEYSDAEGIVSDEQ